MHVGGTSYAEYMSPRTSELLERNPSKHLRVLGLSQSGKTGELLDAARHFVRNNFVRRPKIIVPSRHAQAALRDRAVTDAQVTDAKVVSTPVSFALEILQQFAHEAGVPAPRLLNGADQDELVAAVLEAQPTASLPPGSAESEAFRSSMRALWAKLDDYDTSPADLQRIACDALLAAEQPGAPAGHRAEDAIKPYLQIWQDAATVLAEVVRRNDELNERGTPALTESGLCRAARECLRQHPEVRSALPDLILVDDAQDVSEGALGLLATCAQYGSAIWAFGLPDLTTSAFSGDGNGMLHNLTSALKRKLPANALLADEQPSVVLPAPSKPSSLLQGLQTQLVQRLGGPHIAQLRRCGGLGRVDASANDVPVSLSEAIDRVTYAEVTTQARQISALAYRVRSAVLGVATVAGMNNVDWSDIAVVARSRQEVLSVAEGLSVRGIPTRILGGGTVLRNERIVRDLATVALHALEDRSLTFQTLLKLLEGPLIGVDSVALRALSSKFAQLEFSRRQDKRESMTDQEDARLNLSEVPVSRDTWPFAKTDPETSSGEAPQQARLLLDAFARAQQEVANGSSLSLVLHGIWEVLGLEQRLLEQTEDARPVIQRAANRHLDAVIELWSAVGRESLAVTVEEQASVLRDLLTAEIPQDSVALRTHASAVTIATPHAFTGRHYPLVCLVGVQDGSWPNLKLRGNFLGTHTLEQLLRGAPFAEHTRAEMLRDETRLLLKAVTRAEHELFIITLNNAQNFPGGFKRFFAQYEVDRVPETGMTVRGEVAALRAQLEQSVTKDAAHDLAVFADEHVDGAHPDAWYGVRAPADDNSEKAAELSLSPSHLEAFAACPLNWLLSRLEGPKTDRLWADFGTLMHRMFEQIDTKPLADLQNEIAAEMADLPYPAQWVRAQEIDIAGESLANIQKFVQDSQSKDGWEPAAHEFPIAVDLGVTPEGIHVRLKGSIDRVETRTSDYGIDMRVVDLKSGKNVPTVDETRENLQLAAYQLALRESGQELLKHSKAHEYNGQDLRSVEAVLFFPRPASSGSKTGTKRAQGAKSAEDLHKLREDFLTMADQMSHASFEARVEQHCTQDGHHACQIHVIPAVSYR